MLNVFLYLPLIVIGFFFFLEIQCRLLLRDLFAQKIVPKGCIVKIDGECRRRAKALAILTHVPSKLRRVY